MPRNLPTVKLATGSRNPYFIEELTASPPCLYIKHFSFYSFHSKIVNSQMTHNLLAVKLVTGSRSPYPIEELAASSSLALY